MAGILGTTFYGGSWEESDRKNVKSELDAELAVNNAKISNILITVSKMQRPDANGVLVDVLDRHSGQPVYTKNMVLNLVSTILKDANDNPKFLGQKFLRLSRKSKLESGDMVDPESVVMITLSKVGEPDHTYFDGEVLKPQV